MGRWRALGLRRVVVSAVLPKSKLPPERGIDERTTRGLRIYLVAPRILGLLPLILAIAAGSAMVIVSRMFDQDLLRPSAVALTALPSCARTLCVS